MQHLAQLIQPHQQRRGLDHDKDKNNLVLLEMKIETAGLPRRSAINPLHRPQSVYIEGDCQVPRFDY